MLFLVFYSETLSGDDIPPSFKGLSVKYLYKLTIGIQHADSPVKLLRIPLRVLTLPGKEISAFIFIQISIARFRLFAGLADMCSHGGIFSSSHPLNADFQHRPSTIDIANELIETITSGKSQRAYF